MGASEFQANSIFLPATVHLRHGPLNAGRSHPALPKSFERRFVDERWTEAGKSMPKAHSSSVIDINDGIGEAITASSDSDAAETSAVANYETAEKAPDIIALLPKIRLVARGLIDDAVAADKLVELTLERAVAAIRSREDHHHVEAWLTALLEDTFKRIGPNLRRLFATQEQ